MKAILIPKANNIISSNYFVDCFVEHVRANNYPHFEHTWIQFEGADNDTAMCSEWDMSEHKYTLYCMQLYISGELKNKDVCVNSFEGGMYEVHGSCFTVVVNDHMYFFNF